MSKVSNEIAVEERKEFGTNAARRARRAGMIPASIYSKGKDARSLYVDADAWKVLSGHHGSGLISLIEGGNKTAALVKDVQRNHLKNYVQHIDFLEVSMDEEIHTQVSLTMQGESVGVVRGGVLDQDLHHLDIKCKPGDLPETIFVDVTGLNIGDSIHVKDIVLPHGVSLVHAAELESIICSVVRPQEEEAAPVAAAPAEGDAAAAADAAAPAEGDAKKGDAKSSK